MKIKKSALDFILGVSREIFPKEFSGLLRGDKELIEETLVIPGTIFGDTFSTQRRDMAPFDSSVIGTIHSHPGRNANPSKADRDYFERMGFVHIIVRYPYESLDDVFTYDRKGNNISLEILE